MKVADLVCHHPYLNVVIAVDTERSAAEVFGAELEFCWNDRIVLSNKILSRCGLRVVLNALIPSFETPLKLAAGRRPFFLILNLHS